MPGMIFLPVRPTFRTKISFRTILQRGFGHTFGSFIVAPFTFYSTGLPPLSAIGVMLTCRNIRESLTLTVQPFQFCISSPKAIFRLSKSGFCGLIGRIKRCPSMIMGMSYLPNCPSAGAASILTLQSDARSPCFKMRRPFCGSCVFASGVLCGRAIGVSLPSFAGLRD